MEESAAYMTPASVWRLAQARRLAAIYAANPKVAAVLAGGSTARGQADGYSDLEIGVFWHAPPTEEDRQAVVTVAGADGGQLYPYDADYDVWEDAYMLGRAAPDLLQTGLLVEVPHYMIATVDRMLDDVLERYSTNDDVHSVLAAFQIGIPLYGAPLIHRWQARVAHYPDALAVAVITQYGQIEFFWRIEMLLARSNNRVMIYSELNRMTNQLLHMLLGLNRMYYPGFKWLDYWIGRMALVPPDCAARLKEVFGGDPLAGSMVLAALIEETYDLVERQIPAVNLAQLRRWFRWRRPIWEQPPPGLALEELSTPEGLP